MSERHDTSRVLLGLQVMDVLLALGCVGFGGCMTVDLLDQMTYTHNQWPAAAAVMFVLVIAGCLTAQTVFFLLCGRLKQHTAFTPDNDRALGVIAAICGVNSVLLLLTGAAETIGQAMWAMHVSAWAQAADEALAYALSSDGAFYGLLTFLMASVALIAWILQLLLRRAVTLQQENDETV